MTGNTIVQYRAAIGIYYCKSRGVLKSKMFTLFNVMYLFLFFLTCCKKSLKHLHINKTFVENITYLHFWFQVLFLQHMISGDIEANPGPTDGQIHTLDIFHLNIRSIRHKIQSLETFVSDFDILCFTETHLDSKVCDSDILLYGYGTIFRRDRNSHGGGILICVPSTIKASRRIDLDPSSIECIWLEICEPTCNFFLCCIYRPPNSDKSFWDKFSWSLDKVSDISSKFLILGDLNVDFLENSRLYLIRDIMMNYNLTNTIHEATRTTDTTNTLIDPVLKSTDLVSLHSGVINTDDTLSDHKATYIFLKTGIIKSKPYIRNIWDYKNADITKLNTIIENTDWDSIINNAISTDNATKRFTDKCLELVRECIPEKSVTIRPKDKPWFDSDLRTTLRKKIDLDIKHFKVILL